MQFLLDVDYLHRNRDNGAEGYGVRETETTTNHPRASREVQGALTFCAYPPTLIGVPGGRSFEGQQHSGYHDRHEHIAPGESSNLVQLLGEDQQEHVDDAGGAQKEDVNGHILNYGLYDRRHSDRTWAAPQEAHRDDNESPHIEEQRQHRVDDFLYLVLDEYTEVSVGEVRVDHRERGISDCLVGHEQAQTELKGNSHDETPGDKLMFHRDCINSDGQDQLG